MCGIVGVAGRTAWPGRDRLAAMRDALAHRGPDDCGEWWSADGLVGLGHRRLAIIDLSPGGHQPMLDATGRLAIVFNGEIYNYRDLRHELELRGHSFRSASDTEVLLEAYREWGAACVEHLNGMFAFALHDASSRTLFFARDRAGEKPLYFREEGGRLFFGSELKALVADPDAPRRLDPEALDHYLCYGYVPGELCLLAGFRKLPPAHAAAYDVATGVLRTWRYWSVPPPDGTVEPAADWNAAGESERLGELEELLFDSVRLRLVADVPVGILLSGGVDSGLVAAMAARARGAVRTFTVSLPGRAGLDEGPAARRVAEHLGTDHTQVVAEAASFDLVPLLARQYDEPIADYSMIPTFLVSRAIREHATVALGGDGGDELFGGYPHYEWLAWQERARRVLPGPVRRAVAGAAGHLPPGVPGRNHFAGVDGDLARAIAHVNLYFDAKARARLSRVRPPAGVTAPEARRAALCAGGDTRLEKATRADFLSTLPDGYLVKVDRASMLASLEVRAPFLDHRLVEFAFARVPDSLKLRGGRRKVLTRALAERLLPKGQDFDTKRGFTVPLGEWLCGPWRDGVGDLLRSTGHDLLASGEVEALLAEKRLARNAGRIYALLVLELWRREYRVAL